ncbi:MAG: hypothetical protein KAG66_13005, partial [Methylococcales bacterium]|nr:hypothetical protein [Methylococcales bacterium]
MIHLSSDHGMEAIIATPQIGRLSAGENSNTASAAYHLSASMSFMVCGKESPSTLSPQLVSKLSVWEACVFSEGKTRTGM